MSHVVAIETETIFDDIEIIKETAKELGCKCWEQENFVQYDGSKTSGTFVQLPHWKYPICIEKDGNIKADNYKGAWGNENEVKKFEEQYKHEFKSLQALKGVKEKLNKAKMKYSVKKEHGQYVVEAEA